MRFEYYILRLDSGGLKEYNIFDYPRVNEKVEKEVRKYLRSKARYRFPVLDGGYLYGFDGLCEFVRVILASVAMCRFEFEFNAESVSTPVCKARVDGYIQAFPNIKTIARDIIAQYKEQR